MSLNTRTTTCFARDGRQTWTQSCEGARNTFLHAGPRKNTYAACNCPEASAALRLELEVLPVGPWVGSNPYTFPWKPMSRDGELRVQTHWLVARVSQTFRNRNAETKRHANGLTTSARSVVLLDPRRPSPTIRSAHWWIRVTIRPLRNTNAWTKRFRTTLRRQKGGTHRA